MKKLTEYIKNLDSLTEKTQPFWGQMTPQHMLEHLILAVQSSNGQFTFKKMV